MEVQLSHPPHLESALRLFGRDNRPSSIRIEADLCRILDMDFQEQPFQRRLTIGASLG
jgi:hypothetical protein